MSSQGREWPSARRCRGDQSFDVSLAPSRWIYALTLHTMAQDETHLALLRQLWASLQPTRPFIARSHEWTRLGFQGDDPTTDFRGMGCLVCVPAAEAMRQSLTILWQAMITDFLIACSAQALRELVYFAELQAAFHHEAAALVDAWAEGEPLHHGGHTLGVYIRESLGCMGSSRVTGSAPSHTIASVVPATQRRTQASVPAPCQAPFRMRSLASTPPPGCGPFWRRAGSTAASLFGEPRCRRTVAFMENSCAPM